MSRVPVMSVAHLDHVRQLREQVAQTGSRVRVGVSVGMREIDDRLAGEGLAADALHEIAPAGSTLADDAAATLFAAGAAARFARAADGAVLWAVTKFDLYAPGLEQAGLPGDAILFAQAREDAEVLALAEDGARERTLAAVVVEARRVGMVATRRLQLAAEEGRTPILLLRRWRRSGNCPLGEPSVAQTRWRIGCAPSGRLNAPGVGRARWSVELVRQRGGAPFSILVEACNDEGHLALPATASDRTAEAGGASARAA